MANIVQDIQQAQGTPEKHIDQSYNFYQQELQNVSNAMQGVISSFDDVARFQKSLADKQAKEAEKDLSGITESAQALRDVLGSTAMTDSQARLKVDEWYKNWSRSVDYAKMNQVAEANGLKPYLEKYVGDFYNKDADLKKAQQSARIAAAQANHPGMALDEALKLDDQLIHQAGQLEFFRGIASKMSPKQQQAWAANTAAGLDAVVGTALNQQMRAIIDEGGMYTVNDPIQYGTVIKKSLMSQGVTQETADAIVDPAVARFKILAENEKITNEERHKEAQAYIDSSLDYEMQEFLKGPDIVVTISGTKRSISRRRARALLGEEFFKKLIMDTPGMDAELQNNLLSKVIESKEGNKDSKPEEITTEAAISICRHCTALDSIANQYPVGSPESKGVSDISVDAQNALFKDPEMKNFSTNPVGTPVNGYLKPISGKQANSLAHRATEVFENLSEMARDNAKAVDGKFPNSLVLLDSAGNSHFYTGFIDASGYHMEERSNGDFKRDLKNGLDNVAYISAFTTGQPAKSFIDEFNRQQLMTSDIANQFYRYDTNSDGTPTAEWADQAIGKLLRGNLSSGMPGMQVPAKTEKKSPTYLEKKGEEIIAKNWEGVKILRDPTGAPVGVEQQLDNIPEQEPTEISTSPVFTSGVMQLNSFQQNKPNEFVKYKANAGSDIAAPFDGVVTFVSKVGAKPDMVFTSADGTTSLALRGDVKYTKGPFDSSNSKEVSKGDVVGTVGDTGDIRALASVLKNGKVVKHINPRQIVEAAPPVPGMPPVVQPVSGEIKAGPQAFGFVADENSLLDNKIQQEAKTDGEAFAMLFNHSAFVKAIDEYKNIERSDLSESEKQKALEEIDKDLKDGFKVLRDMGYLVPDRIEDVRMVVESQRRDYNDSYYEVGTNDLKNGIVANQVTPIHDTVLKGEDLAIRNKIYREARTDGEAALILYKHSAFKKAVEEYKNVINSSLSKSEKEKAFEDIEKDLRKGFSNLESYGYLVPNRIEDVKSFIGAEEREKKRSKTSKLFIR